MSQRLKPQAVPYADPARLLNETLDALLPPRRITVAEHAEQHRWVKAAVGGHLVRWDHAEAPYLVEPMEALTSGEHSTVAIVGPGACGKTMVAENWLLQSIDADPADLLWYMQTDPAKDAYVKGRIEPLIEAHDKLIGSLRHGRDSVEFKRFRGMRAEFLAFTSSNLINKHVARIVADEIDAYDERLGDPMALLNPRRQAAGADSMLLAISHPDLGLPIQAPQDRQRGVMGLYAGSDRRTWWWPCPRCGGFSSPNPGTGRRMFLQYDENAPLDEIRAATRMVCPHCGEKSENHERKAMLQAGRWVGLGEEIDDDGRVSGQRRPMDTAGFWIVGMMSPFTMDGIGGLAAARVAAERALAVSGDDAGLRQIMVKSWGEPYQPPRAVGVVDAQALADRAVPPDVMARGVVPPGARAIFTAVDAQKGRWELLSRAVGVGMESWVIDFRVIEGEPTSSPEDWDALLRELAGLAYPLSDGSGRVMRVRGATFDSAGEAGVTEQAYGAWLRARRAGLARNLGRIGGRDAWTLVPAKGASGANAPRLTLSYPDTQRADRKAAARGEVPVMFFNPNLAKDALSAQLGRAEVGPGYVHLPGWLLSPDPPHLWFEQLAAEKRNRRGAWEKVVSSARNEAIDLMTMSESVARLHGVHRINWDAAPAWALEWDRNPMVVAGPTGTPAEASRAAPVAAVLAPRLVARPRPPVRRVSRSAYMG